MTDYCETADAFVAQVLQHFAFLTMDMAFMKPTEDRRDFGVSSTNPSVSVSYVSRDGDLRVVVELDCGEANLTVSIEDLKSCPPNIPCSIWGQKQYGAAMELRAYLAMSDMRDPLNDLMPEPRHGEGRRKASHQKLVRSESIQHRLSDVVIAYAKQLHDRCWHILAGDTSGFQRVQAYYRRQLKKQLSRDGSHLV